MALVSQGTISHFLWSAGDFSAHRVDDVLYVASDRLPVTKGLWQRIVEQFDPRWFGARADGVSDDTRPLQACLDAIAASGEPGTMRLSGTYKIGNPGLRVDSRLVSINGDCVVDAKSMTIGSAFTLYASNRSPIGNSWGQCGLWLGNMLIVGPGSISSVDAINFSGSIEAVNVRTNMTRVSISHFRYGHVHGDYSYNSLFSNCDFLFCSVGIVWIKGKDNGERQSYIGCIFANGGNCVRHFHPEGILYLNSCSLDYTDLLFDIDGGRVYATDCHIEGSGWADGKAKWDSREQSPASGPIRLRGHVGMLHIRGGFMVYNVDRGGAWLAREIAAIEAPAEMMVEGVSLHALQPRGSAPTRWASGSGRLLLRNNSSFDEARLPQRLHEKRTMLVDPGFDSVEWADPISIYLQAGSQPASRLDGSNIQLSKVRGGRDGRGALRAHKGDGSGSVAAFSIASAAVEFGDRVMAGFWHRTDPAMAPRHSAISVYWIWAKFDRYDANGIPVYSHREVSGGLDLQPSASWQYVSSLGLVELASAPAWANHYWIEVNLFRSDAGSYLFDDVWIDKW